MRANWTFPCSMRWPRRALRRSIRPSRAWILQPLFETIVSTIPPATGDAEGTLQILVTNLDYSDYFGRIAICRVFQGNVACGRRCDHLKARRQPDEDAHYQALHVFRPQANRDHRDLRWATLWLWQALKASPSARPSPALRIPSPLPLIVIDEPTIAIQFSVNNSPFAGREGQYVTSRNLRERLEKGTADQRQHSR
jgi:GTP-binding protein